MAPSAPRTRATAALRMKQLALDNQDRTIRRLRAQLATERRGLAATKKELKETQVALEASHKVIAGLTEMGLSMSKKIEKMKVKKQLVKANHVECHQKFQAHEQPDQISQESSNEQQLCASSSSRSIASNKLLHSHPTPAQSAGRSTVSSQQQENGQTSSRKTVKPAAGKWPNQQQENGQTSSRKMAIQRRKGSCDANQQLAIQRRKGSSDANQQLAIQRRIGSSDANQQLAIQRRKGSSDANQQLAIQRRKGSSDANQQFANQRRKFSSDANSAVGHSATQRQQRRKSAVRQSATQIQQRRKFSS
ncbi:hypothetical protein F511_31237 [Dorcoceras hygrometricum]|uniref:Uncharacterized protein n=1 Tax=Dorcoceras hygrometricum TaxID=472368 RepID=A0A2Z7BGJ0_9LAMI|nr:hypothetical protein F511_31237 [Dorcoceras hygrometricum]